MEVGQRITSIIREAYIDVKPSVVIKIKDMINEERTSYQSEIVNNQQEFEARKIALEAAVKTYGQTGGDLTENAIKYKRFLLNETVNEN